MKKALIVEDSKPIADVWNLTLLREGFESVETLHDSNNVLETVDRLHPDIVLMDINIPGEYDGIELTSLLTSKYEDLKVLILTFHNEPEIMKRSFEAGANGYVVKSSGLKEIRQAINEVFEGKKYICETMR